MCIAIQCTKLLCAALKSLRSLVSTVYRIFQTGCLEHFYLLNVTMISHTAWTFSYRMYKKSSPFLYSKYSMKNGQILCTNKYEKILWNFCFQIHAYIRLNKHYFSTFILHWIFIKKKKNLCYLIFVRHLISSRAGKNQIFSPNIHIFLHECATISELQSHIIVMKYIDENRSFHDLWIT